MAKRTPHHPDVPSSLLAADLPAPNAGTGLELTVRGGGNFRVLTAHNLDNGQTWGLARGVNTGALVRFVASPALKMTSFRSVKLVAAVDTGDAEGTLVFPVANEWPGRVLASALDEVAR